MEQKTPEQKGLHRSGNLYGVDLLLGGAEVAEVENYIEIQEKTHIAEGLALMQRTVRTLPFTDGHTVGFGGKPMVEVNKEGYRSAQKQFLSGDEAAEGLKRRRSHDIAIAERCDQLMSEGKVGDGFMVCSPYAEEWDTQTAARLGMWPKYRRGYAWLYRKKNDAQLECIDVSLDESSVASFGALLRGYGAEVPEGIESHDMPGLFAAFHAANEDARDELIDKVIKDYRVINQSNEARSASNAFEAVEFLDEHAKDYLKLVVEVHKSVAASLASGSLDDLVRISTSRALKTLTCLSSTERSSLKSLLTSTDISAVHRPAFETLLTAQRYGIWNLMADIVKTGNIPQRAEAAPSVQFRQGAIPIGAIHFLDRIYDSTNTAAKKGETMPGCAGGQSFLEQSEADIKESIFGSGGKEDRNNWKWKRGVCRVESCPTRPGETKIGPCDVCERCQSKFDAGIDPTKEAAPVQKTTKPKISYIGAAVTRKLSAKAA